MVSHVFIIKGVIHPKILSFMYPYVIPNLYNSFLEHKRVQHWTFSILKHYFLSREESQSKLFELT